MRFNRYVLIIFSLFFLSGLRLSTFLYAEGPEFILRFKATENPYLIASTSVFEKELLWFNGKTESGGETVSTIFERQVSNPGLDVLVVRRKIVLSGENYNTSRMVINSLGKPLIPPKEKSLFPVPRISLQFPEHKVGKGSFWSYVIPENSGFPAETAIHCKITAINEINGNITASINMKSTSKATYEAQNFTGFLNYKSKLVFDVNLGRVETVSSKTVLTTKSLTEEGNKPKETSLTITVKSTLFKP